MDALERAEKKIKSGERLVFGDPDIIAKIKHDELTARLLKAREKCELCFGAGEIKVTNQCPRCSGKGATVEVETCECQNIE